MLNKFLLFIVILGTSLGAKAAVITCEKSDKVIQFKESYGKKWATTRFVDSLTRARLKIDTEARSKNSAEYVEISNLVEGEDNPFITMGLKDGDRIYGTENLTFDGKNDFLFYINILTGRSHCLKIDRANETKVFRYILTKN